MRARNIKPGFFVNEQLAECCFAARILFEGLWCLADREGRLEDKPKKIKALVFPYDDINADELLQELHTHGLIVRYEVDGAKYIDIPKFRVHQRPHQNETASIIPPRKEPLASKSEEVGSKDKSACNHGKKDFAPRNKALRSESLILNTESLNIKPKRIGQSAGALSADADPMNEANPVPSPSVESNLPSVGASRKGAILADKSAVKADCTSIEIDPANDGDFDLTCGPPGRASPPGQKNEVAPDMSIAATPEQIAELWNSIMPQSGFSKVVSLSDTRKRHVKARQREFRQHGAERIDFWRTVFAEVQKTPFMRGENDRGWRADFDFCTESHDKLLRIIEGKYRSDKQVGTRWEAY